MMNRFLAIIGSSLLIFLSVDAMASGAIRVGVEGGFIYSSLAYDEEMEIWDTGARSTFSLGAFLDIPTAERVSFVPGLRYVRYGNAVDIDTGEHPYVRVRGDFEVTQNYLAVPALLRIRPVDSAPIFMTFGPEIGILINANQKGTQIEEFAAQDSVAVSTFDDDICGEMDMVNLSLDVGAGIEFPVGEHRGSVQVRYAFGLIGTAMEEEWFSDWKTRGVEVMAGVTW